eukprot:scaffold2157_cov376-Prasinococcus_capsulatus_cf.AAC.16
MFGPGSRPARDRASQCPTAPYPCRCRHSSLGRMCLTLWRSAAVISSRVCRGRGPGRFAFCWVNASPLGRSGRPLSPGVGDQPMWCSEQADVRVSRVQRAEPADEARGSGPAPFPPPPTIVGRSQGGVKLTSRAERLKGGPPPALDFNVTARPLT